MMISNWFAKSALILIPLFFMSCSKKEDEDVLIGSESIIKGNFYFDCSKANPLKHETLMFYQVRIGSIVDPGEKVELIETLVTDENGFYEIKVDRCASASIRIKNSQGDVLCNVPCGNRTIEKWDHFKYAKSKNNVKIITDSAYTSNDTIHLGLRNNSKPVLSIPGPFREDTSYQTDWAFFFVGGEGEYKVLAPSTPKNLGWFALGIDEFYRIGYTSISYDEFDIWGFEDINLVTCGIGDTIYIDLRKIP